VDSHNSVHGIREFARHQNANVRYIDSTATGGFDVLSAKVCIYVRWFEFKFIKDVRQVILLENRPSTPNACPSLFAMTGQSNISNSKNPLSMLEYASSLGYYTLLDAAALAPTSLFSLKDTPVDAMAISFYKMFGFPTGVGALVVKKSFLETLRRPWFAGGNVDVVQGS
jgi:molybdenum cofactor sulfurtransferase